jgi:hypothetical protein
MAIVRRQLLLTYHFMIYSEEKMADIIYRDNLSFLFNETVPHLSTILPSEGI